MLVVTDDGRLFDVIHNDHVHHWDYPYRSDGSPLVIQKGLKPLRDGSKIERVHRVWITGYYAYERIMICEATTDRGVKVLCSQGTEGRIGRAVTETEPRNEFHLMNYE